MSHLKYAKEPARTLFLTYQALSTLFFRIPFWMTVAIFRPLRPRKSWDFKRTVLVNLIRHIFDMQVELGPLFTSPDYRAITPSRGAEGVWIPPTPKYLIVGKLDQWADHAGVSPIRIPGYWLHKERTNIEVGSSPTPGEKVILSFHGGAYIRLSAHPSDPTAAIARSLVNTVDCVKRVLSVEYRLSSENQFQSVHPFPAALLDGLAGYVYLVEKVGYPPSDIIIEGDSAGGNLAHALTRYLLEYKGTLRLPGPPSALLLLSPWGDLGQSHHNTPNAPSVTCYSSDHLGSPPYTMYLYAMRAFVGPHGPDAAEINPYISPASLNPSLVIDFKNFPRTFILAGGAEILRDSLHTLRDKMIKDLGEGNGILQDEGKLRYHEAPDGVHDFLMFSWHQPEVDDALRAISDWISLA